MSAQRRHHAPNQKLRQAREERNWTQLNVADALGTTKLVVGRWERGERIPRRFFWGPLCKLFGKSAIELGLLSDTAEKTGQAAMHAVMPTYWNVPYQRNFFFTGREEVLQQMHTVLSQPQTPFALRGLGGIGKTQVALEYVYRHASTYTATFWITAETLETLYTGFSLIADQLQLEKRAEKGYHQQVEAVLHWLVSHKDWFLVFDNVESIALLKPFIPSSPQGCILLTTRLHSVEGLAPSLEIPAFTVEEGVSFLLSRVQSVTVDTLSQPTHPSPALLESATLLVQTLDGLPLAIDQAGAYIERTACTPTDYLQLFQTYQIKLLDERSSSADHPLSVAGTFLLSFERLIETDPGAADLLRVCSLLAPDAIPEEIFLNGGKHLGSLLHSVSQNAYRFNHMVGSAVTYSLLKRQSHAHTLSVHRLVQIVLAHTMSKTESMIWLQRCIFAVEFIFPEPEPHNWHDCQRLLPHALACIEQANAAAYNHLSLASLSFKAACYLHTHAHKS